MSEPTTCARCGMTDEIPKQRRYGCDPLHYSDAHCIEALGAAVRELQAQLANEHANPVVESVGEPGASAGSNVGAPEVDHAGIAAELRGIATVMQLMRETGVGAMGGSADAERVLRVAADMLAKQRAPTIPDPDTLEAWADWYDEHMPGAKVKGAINLRWLQVSDVLRRAARAHRAATQESTEQS